MYSTNLFEDSEAHKIISQLGKFSVIEYEKDYSTSIENAQLKYYASVMNVKKRQLIINTTEEEGVIVQAGAMQFLAGEIEASSNILGLEDLAKKIAGSIVTNETAVKPLFIGDGIVVLEPSFKYIILQDLNDWGNEMVIEDGTFLACDNSVELKIAERKSFSSMFLGGEGFFNTLLIGEGIVALESAVPMEELIMVSLEESELRIDGNIAIAWSHDLEFTVEKATKSLIGSTVSKEGFVNVYRGTGKVLLAPVRNNKKILLPKEE